MIVLVSETTVGTLGTADVGVANLWERDYVDAAGRARNGVTARLMWESDGAPESLIVGVGSRFEVGGARWEVLAVEKRVGVNGAVRLLRLG